MVKKVLITAPYMQPEIDRFKSIFEENNIQISLPPVKERLSEEELLECIDGVHGVISGDDQFTERVLKQAKNLKVISKWGTGIDSIDLDACERLDVAVRNTVNAFSEPVADSVLGYMLCFARKLYEMDKNMKRGDWEKIPGLSLGECTLGVIGVGNVGKAVVRRAVAFGMKIFGNDLLEMPVEFIAATGIKMVSKKDLLEQSDFVSLNCDLNPTSHHIMGAEEFKLMKPTSYFINTARGPLVDEQELVKALQNNQIAGAALDVFEVEPLPEGNPLRGMANVLLAPHNANSSQQAWERVHKKTINNLLDVLFIIKGND
jgi:D-3-phosphoglycerate dehydrogenase